MLVGQTVQIGMGRQGVMKRRVENGDLRYGRKQLAHRADTGHVYRVVQRRQRVERLDRSQHLVGDQRSFRKLLTAMHDAMGDDADLAHPAQHAGFPGGEFGVHGRERLGKSALGQLAFHFALRPALHQPGARDADPLDLSARQATWVGRVVETVFERGRAAVDDQDLRWPFTLQLEAVRIIAWTKCRGRLGWIGQEQFHPLADGSRDLLHRPWFGHNHGLEQGYGNQQHLRSATRL